MRALIVLAGLVIGAGVAEGQAPKADPVTTWLSLGLGVGGLGGSIHDSKESGGGAFGDIAGTVQVHRVIVSARISGVTRVLGDDVYDLGILAGVGTRPGRWHALAAAGIGVAGGTKTFGIFGKPSENIPTEVAFPVEVQVSWRPTKIFGFGLFGSGSFRSGQHHFGLGLGILLGALR